jgi:hypothetical protein
MSHHENRVNGKHNKQVVESELKINSALNKRTVQRSLVCEPALVVVVLEVTPAELRPEPPDHLKLKPALDLIAPVRTIHRFSHDGPPLPVQFERGPGVGVKSTYIAFRVKRCASPDLHLSAGADHWIYPIYRTRKSPTSCGFPVVGARWSDAHRHCQKCSDRLPCSYSARRQRGRLQPYHN